MIVPRNKNPTDQIYELALYVYRFKNDDFVINDVKTNKTTTICKTVIISEMFLLESSYLETTKILMLWLITP